MDIIELKNWAFEHKIEEQTINSFYEMLDNYKTDDPEEFNDVFKNIRINDLSLQVHTISLNLGNWPECSYNTVSASMWIHHKEKQIASYKAIYTLDGEPEDDFFDLF